MVDHIFVLALVGLSLWLILKRSTSFPIDGVWTWVDGSDKGWSERRSLAYSSQDDEAKNHTPLAIHQKRAKDELFYSLAFSSFTMPWLRKRFVVCPSGHQPSIPSWMRVEIVQDDLLSSSSQETFSSECILANLDKIPGLAEHFLSINDDIFVLHPLKPQDFFTRKGKPIWFPIRQDRHPPGSLYESALQASAAMTKTPRSSLLTSPHTPNPMTKTIFGQLRKTLAGFETLCQDFPLRIHGCPSVPHLIVNGAPELVHLAQPSFRFRYFEDHFPPQQKDLVSEVICINNLGPKTPPQTLDYIFGLLEGVLEIYRAPVK